MPSTILLVDIFHDVSRNVLVHPNMNPGLIGLFMEIRTHLTARKKVAICVEGLDLNGGLHPTAPAYNHFIRQMWPDLAMSGIFPRVSMYGADPRSSTIDQRYEDHLKFVTNYAVFDAHPNNLEEAFDWIKSGKLPARIVRPSNKKNRENAKYAMESERIFQSAYIKLVRSLAENHDYIYVIAGAAHIIEMHLRTKWPMKWLTATAPQSSVTDIYQSYTHFHTLAQLVIDTRL